MPARTYDTSGNAGALVVPGIAAGCSGIILAIVAACVVGGIGAAAGWAITGSDAWIRQFFEVPAALFTVWLAAIGLWLSLTARAQFAPDELMRRVWTLISFSAAAEMAGSLCIQILGAESRLNPLARWGGVSHEFIANVRTAGYLAGGPVRFALLTGGIWLAVKAYRRVGFVGRLRPWDWALLAGITLYLARNVVDVVVAVRAGKVVTWSEAARWPTDPLLCALLGLAFVLYRSVCQMGSGWIGRCWRALALGVFLTVAGDVGAWAEAYSYIPYPWSATVWFVWLPASACFALAPAYQLEAIRNAYEGRYR